MKTPDDTNLMHAAGRSALHLHRDVRTAIQKDFAAAFHSNPPWTSYFNVADVELHRKAAACPPSPAAAPQTPEMNAGHIYFGDARVGTIAIRSWIPHDKDQWGWSCGFYPGAEAGAGSIIQIIWISPGQSCNTFGYN